MQQCQTPLFRNGYLILSSNLILTLITSNLTVSFIAVLYLYVKVGFLEILYGKNKPKHSNKVRVLIGKVKGQWITKYSAPPVFARLGRTAAHIL